MLIVGGKPDYYDCIRAWGVDKAVVYDRTTTEVAFKLGRRAMHVDKCTAGGIDVELMPLVIGFCGNIYPLVMVSAVDTESALKIAPIHYYVAEELALFVSRWRARTDRYFWRDGVLDPRGAKAFFDPSSHADLLPVFQKHKVPAFVLGRFGAAGNKGKLILNPCLKDYKFFKVRDTATAFQELYNFISGVLGAPECKLVKVSDKVRAAKAGHDHPYSFRKTPTNKKRGKKRAKRR
jgi:hypothetical protein